MVWSFERNVEPPQWRKGLLPPKPRWRDRFAIARESPETWMRIGPFRSGKSREKAIYRVHEEPDWYKFEIRGQCPKMYEHYVFVRYRPDRLPRPRPPGVPPIRAEESEPESEVAIIESENPPEDYPDHSEDSEDSGSSTPEEEEPWEPLPKLGVKKDLILDEVRRERARMASIEEAKKDRLRRYRDLGKGN